MKYTEALRGGGGTVHLTSSQGTCAHLTLLLSGETGQSHRDRRASWGLNVPCVLCGRSRARHIKGQCPQKPRSLYWPGKVSFRCCSNQRRAMKGLPCSPKWMVPGSHQVIAPLSEAEWERLSSRALHQVLGSAAELLGKQAPKEAKRGWYLGRGLSGNTGCCRLIQAGWYNT